jgi:hypothetical protein
VALLRNPGGDLSSEWHLVCWVPEPFVDLADRGIRVNPEACILWLADARLPIAERLRRDGRVV